MRKLCSEVDADCGL